MGEATRKTEQYYRDKLFVSRLTTIMLCIDAAILQVVFTPYRILVALPIIVGALTAYLMGREA